MPGGIVGPTSIYKEANNVRGNEEIRQQDFWRFTHESVNNGQAKAIVYRAHRRVERSSSMDRSTRGTRSLSEKQCSKRYASLVECKDANYSTTKSRLL